MAKSRRLNKVFLFGLALTGASLLFNLRGLNNAYADTSAATCKSQAASKYGERYTIHQATFDHRCEHDMGGNGNYGTAVPEYTKYPEWTRLSGETLSFNIHRVVFSTGSNSFATGADVTGCIENNISDANIDGPDMELMQIKPGTQRTWIGTGTYHKKLSGTATKGNWSEWGNGGSLTVSFNPSSVAGDVSVDGSGLVSKSFNITTHLFCYNTKTATNTIYYKFYKITRIIHSNSQKATYNGTNYTSSSTSSSSPIAVEEGNISFTHQLARNDGWTNPSSASLTDVYKRKITKGSTVISEDSSWQSASFGASSVWTNVTDSVAISSLSLDPGTATEICSTVTHRKVKGLHGHVADDDNASNVDTSTICVWVKDDRTILSAKSRSSVNNSIDTGSVENDDRKTVESWGGSRGDSISYPYYFVHQLKVSGDANRAVTLTYNVERSTNGGASWSTVLSNGSKTVNGDARWVEVRGYTDSKSDITLSPGGSSDTICERITFKSTQTVFRGNATTGTANGTSGTSTICTKINRRQPKTATISATCKVLVNGAETDGSTPIFSTNPRFSFQFGFNLQTTNDRSLDTNYTIKRSIGSAAETDVSGLVNKSVTAPKNGISDSPVITFSDSEYGTSKKVCESIYLDPYKYTVHVSGSGNEEDNPEAIAGSTKAATCCATVAMPKREWRDDGEITVFSESSAEVDPNTVGPYSDTHSAYLMTGDTAIVNYTHKLSRQSEKHTGNGTNQAVATSPGDDIIDLKYRFADPSKNFSISDFDSLDKNTLATNSTKTFQSDTRNSLYNENTKITTTKLGEKVTKCQSVYYYSEKYLLQGLYWQVDGEIYSGDSDIQGRGAPIPSPKRTLPARSGTVGKSTEACVSIIRPYNFKISTVSATSEVKPVAQGTYFNPNFSVTVKKNDNDYFITDIKDATVQIIGFSINTENTNIQQIIGTSDGVAGNIDSTVDACTHFRNKLGTTDCAVLSEWTRNFGATPGATGSGYYPNSNTAICQNGNCSYSDSFKSPNPIRVPNLSIKEKYCVAVAIKPANSGSGFVGGFSTNWAISNASCMNIGKWPSVQIWGGSTFTNGGTKTSITTIDSKTFGSWDDFAIVANKPVIRTASGAAYISGLSNSTTCKFSPLTIANRDCSNNNIGQSDINGDAELMDKVFSRYISTSGNIVVTNEVTTAKLAESSTSPIIIYSGKTNKNIYIKERINISTRGTYHNTALPQVIIYAEGDINIDPSVERIDAWLLAKGKVRTCADANGNSKRTDSDGHTCSNKLEILGPVYGEQLLLDRTANGDAYVDSGGNSTLKEPAELIDLSPVIFLFGANEASGGAQPITSYLHRLAPRY